MARQKKQHAAVYVCGRSLPCVINITLHSGGEHIKDVETEDDVLVDKEMNIVFLHEDGMAALHGDVSVAVSLSEAEEFVWLYEIWGCDMFGDGVCAV